MEDNYLNDRLRNSMDTPRNIPFDDNEWEKVAARLDAAKPPKQPFSWHWLALAALIPMLGWNVWLHSKLSNLQQNTSNTKSIVVLDTIVTKHTTMVFDTVYRVIHKTIYKNNVIQSIDNKPFINKKENLLSFVNENNKLGLVSNTSSSIDKKTNQNVTNQAVLSNNDIVKKADINENKTQGNTLDKVDFQTENKELNTQNAAPSVEKNTTTDILKNEEKTVAEPLQTIEKISVDTSNIVSKTLTNIEEKSINSIKKDDFEATTPIKVTPTRSRLHIGLQALSLEGGNNLSHRFEENTSGIGVQFKLSSQWSILTGFQFGGGRNRNFIDSLPRTFTRPKPTNPKDKYRDADIEHYSFNIPIMVRWQPSYFDKYRIKPYLSMGSIFDFGGKAKVGYRFEDQSGKPYKASTEQNDEEINVFAAANVGAEAKIYRKFAIFTQLQYRIPLGKTQKIGDQYQNLMIQGGVKYNF
jgi:hypothetical protein